MKILFPKLSSFLFFATLTLYPFASMQAKPLLNCEETSEKRFVHPICVEIMCHELHAKIIEDGFNPDLIVAIARGGLIPAGYLSGDALFAQRNVYTLSAKSYEKDKQGELKLLLPFHSEDIAHFKSILIVDDIVDTGKTCAFVTKLFKETLKDADIRTATLFYKPLKSVLKPDYFVEAVDEWIVFPWESQSEDLNYLY